MKALAILIPVWILTLIAMAAFGSATMLFYDYTNGTTIDSTKWNLTGINANVNYANGGYRINQTTNQHHRICSMNYFNYSDEYATYWINWTYMRTTTGRQDTHQPTLTINFMNPKNNSYSTSETQDIGYKLMIAGGQGGSFWINNTQASTQAEVNNVYDVACRDSIRWINHTMNFTELCVNGSTMSSAYINKTNGIESGYFCLGLTYANSTTFYNITIETNSTGPATSNYSVSLYDKKAGGGATIQNGNATFTNGASQYFYSTSTGTIQTNLSMNSTDLYNITFMANAYKTLTRQNINITYLNSSLANMSILFKINATNNFNDTILNFTATINSPPINSNSTGWIISTYGYDEGLVNITATSPNQDAYANLNYDMSNDLQINFNFSYYRLNFTAWAYNTTSTGAIVNIYKLINFSLNASDASSSNVYSTTDGTMILNLTKNSNYTLNLDAPGYQFNNASVYMNASWINKNITAFTTNSILFSFLNQTNNPVYNVSIEIIGLDTSYNYTTTPNSTKFIDLIVPGTYQIIYTKSGYSPGYYSFTMTNRSFSNLTLHFITASNNITAYVYDELGSEVAGAIIEVYSYSTTSHAYVFEQQQVTNWQGKAILYLDKYTTFYKFNIKVGGVIKKATEPTYILDDVITFNLQDDTNTGDAFFTSQSITYSLVYNNATNSFRYVYNDLTGTAVTQGCLKITKIWNDVIYDVGSTCINGYSGTLLYNITPQNQTTFIARGYATWGGREYLITQYTQAFGDKLAIGSVGLFFAILLTIACAFTVIYSKVLAIVITPIPLLLMSVIGFVDINWGICAFMEVIALIVAFIIARNQ